MSQINNSDFYNYVANLFFTYKNVAKNIVDNNLSFHNYKLDLPVFNFNRL